MSPPPAMSLLGAAAALLAAIQPAAGGLVPGFRPPAIPLLTTDPYMQTWMMGDNTTADVVRHWDQTPKEMMGMLRVDGRSYRYLGACGVPPLVTPTKPGPAKSEPMHNICPGKGDVSHFATTDIAKCNEACYGHAECTAYVLTRGTCYLKSCTAPIVADKLATLGVITGSRPTPPPPAAYCAVEALQQLSAAVNPTETTFVLRDTAASFQLTLSFVSSMLADDYDRLSRPTYRVVLDLLPLKSVGKASAYLDMSAQHVINETPEPVEWSTFHAGPSVSGVTLGTAAQCVLCEKGDKTNINWGYLYLAPVGTGGGSSRGGSAADQRTSFAKTGVLPTTPDTKMPRSSDVDMPALSAVSTMTAGPASGKGLSASFIVAFDDVASVRYYGTAFKAFWTQKWSSIEEAIEVSVSPTEIAAVSAATTALTTKLLAELTTVGGDEWATVGALAYRQTLAATKLVWNNQTGSIGEHKMWNFLKEISTNGDMQTMDVVFPASPMLLYTNPELLRLLLVPVLNFANNGTDTPFTNPFSPHQLGTYPTADATTASQEPMPMENTGNMFLMLAGIVQRTPSETHDWLKPYMPMLTTWADYLIGSLPFPANQLCTDDFTGRLANNTNLAAKGIVALEAFSHLCAATAGKNCQHYSDAATGFVSTWMKEALEQKPKPHYKIAYNFPNSYSMKYNVVWQKLLNYSKPFPWKEVVIDTEVPYYVSHANKYGPPMDSRHTYVKLDWLAWAATMADDDKDFHAMADPIFAQANATDCRVPLTDLFDTISATCAYGKRAFVARPVVGGVFAKMLAPGPYPY